MRITIHHNNYTRCSHTSSHAFVWIVPSVFALSFYNSVLYVNMFLTLTANQKIRTKPFLWIFSM